MQKFWYETVKFYVSGLVTALLIHKIWTLYGYRGWSESTDKIIHSHSPQPHSFGLLLHQLMKEF